MGEWINLSMSAKIGAIGCPQGFHTSWLIFKNTHVHRNATKKLRRQLINAIDEQRTRSENIFSCARTHRKIIEKEMKGRHSNIILKGSPTMQYLPQSLFQETFKKIVCNR